MKRKNHFFLTFSLSLWLYFSIFKFDLIQTVFLSFFTAYLSWIPDIDIKVVKKLEKLKKRRFLAFLLKPFIFLFKKLLRHRGLTHSIWPILVLVFLDLKIKEYLISIFLKIIYFALIFHILEDSLTISGVNFLYPLNFRLRLAKFRSNSNLHSLFFDIVSLFSILLFFYLMEKNFL
jgi:membrane-bound metal-dependent hydrolase YbcI (DUF457 family)